MSRTEQASSDLAAAARPLTDRQRAILEYLCDHLCEHGYQPDIRALAAHFGWTSPNSIWNHVKAMAAKGYVAMPAGRTGGVAQARALCILRLPDGRPFRGLAFRGDDA